VSASAVFAETVVPLRNPGFEHGLTGWSARGDSGMSTLVADAAHTGETGVRVTDRDLRRGSSLGSDRITVVAGTSYALRFWARAVAMHGVGVYLQFFDARGRVLNRPERRNEINLTVPAAQKTWQQFTLCARAPEDATTVRVWVHSYSRSQATADLDDFTLAQLSEEEARSVKTTRTKDRSGRMFAVPTQARIAEIAELLRVDPAGVGRPIADRAAWDALAALPSAARIVKSAEKIAAQPPPDVPDELYLDFSKTGNRTRYQRPYGRRSRRLATLVKAECLENQGRFLTAIERDVRAICAERSWVMPAHDASLDVFHGRQIHVDLGASARAWLLATADYWLGELLSPETRALVRTEIKRRILDPYLETLRSGRVRGGFWWIPGTSNWNAVCNANIVGTALALVPDPRARAEFLAGMEISNPYFLSGFAADGYCTEGMSYWCYGFGHYMLMGETVWHATDGRLSIYEDESLARIAQYAVGIQIQPGLCPAFADCSTSARPSAWILALIAKRLPGTAPAVASVGDPLASSLPMVGILGFDAGYRGAADVAPASLPLRTWFEHTGLLVTRSAADAGPPFGAAIKGGHNGEHHNHNDVGSFTIALDGKAYLLDPGGEVYTRRTFSRQRYQSKMLNSYGHSAPVVAGTLQSTGRNARGVVLESAFSDDADRLALDLRSAYDVPVLKRLTRTFEHDRTRRLMTVTDAVEFETPQEFGTALITYDKVFRRAPGVFVVYDTAHSVEITVEVEGGEWALTEEPIENPGRPTPTRLGFDMNDPVKSAVIRFAIRPAELPADLPGIYHEPDVSKLRPRVGDAVQVEAENLATQRGGEVTVCAKIGASGQAFKFWDKNGHTLAWRFDVPVTGRYALLLRCCHAVKEPVTRKALIDGEPLGEPGEAFLFPHTGGWSSVNDNWRDVWLAQHGQAVTVKLTAGRHTLTMVNDCGHGLNLDWIKVVPAQ